MSRNCTLFYLLFILSIISPNQSNASHNWGGRIETTCVNACTLKVDVYELTDCSGSWAMNTALNWNGAGGCTPPTLIGTWAIAPSVEITPVCPTILTNCTTPTSMTGYAYQHIYAYFEYCSASACTFVPSRTLCCRNPTITSLVNPGSTSMTSRGNELVLSGLGCNSSPQWHDPTIIYALIGQPISLHVGGFDPDGDSLSYDMGPCLGANYLTGCMYASGFSASNPLGAAWQVILDPVSGLLTITPTPGSIGAGPICIYAYEWRNGVVVGTSVRDIPVIMINNPNANNHPIIGTPTNISGASYVGNNTFTSCGGPMCFEIPITDPNGNVVTANWDQHIAGATFVDANNPSIQNTISGSSPTGRFCFTPSGPGTYQFRLFAQDDFCPVVGRSDAIYTIRVSNGAGSSFITQAGALGSCFTNSVTLSTPLGASAYQWSTGQTTSSISTNIPGSYSVTLTFPGGCSNADTVQVTMPGNGITGTITTHLGAPLANQKVILVSYASGPGTLTSVDTTLTDGAGNYTFCGIADPVVLVKALPDSALYPLEMPTYADTALLWSDGVQFNGLTVQAQVDFSTRGGTNPGGPGFIGGQVALGANKTGSYGDPISNLALLFQDKYTEQIVGIAQTDANGHFRMPNLPIGNYRILTDWPGIINGLEAPVISLTQSGPVRDSLQFILLPQYLELVQYLVGVSQPALEAVQVYPNPSSGTLFLEGFPENEPIKLVLRDMNGRVLRQQEMSNPSYRLEWDLRAFAKGVYWLECSSGKEKWVRKIAIQ